MKKRILLTGIIGFLCSIGEVQATEMCGGAQHPVHSTVYAKTSINVAKSVFLCRESCEKNLKSENCWEMCSDIFSQFYHEELAKENRHDKDEKKEICKDIYRYSYTRKTCQKLPHPLVESMEEINEIMEDPDTDELKEMNIGILSLYVYSGTDTTLKKKLEKYSSREARDFLFWLAHPGICHLPVVNMISDIDKDFRVLEELLEVGNLDTTNGTRLGTFFDLIYQGKNKRAGKWFHNFIEKRECSSSVFLSACVLETYCSLSKSMSDHAAKGLESFPYFATFIKGIIRNVINKSKWSKQDLQSYEDLDSWHKDLCQ